MEIIICGAGRVGYGIANRLSRENNSVTVVDLSTELIQTITTELDVRGIVGHGSHPSVLEQAGGESADMIIAVTHSDEVNMVACEISHALFSTPTKIARVRAQDYLSSRWQEIYSRGNLAIDISISPEIEIGKAILRRLDTPGALEVVPFGNGLVQLLGVVIEKDCPILNMPICQISDLFPNLTASIVGLVRDKQFMAVGPNDQLNESDEVYFVVKTAHASRLLDILGHDEEKARHVVIIGGGNVGTYVASELEKVKGMRVRIIEQDKLRAENTADMLKNTVVLNGDALIAGVQEEAGVRDASTVLCLTNDDKTNILAAIMAKSIGAEQVFSLVNDPSLLVLKSALDIDMVIDPRATTVSSILRHVRKGRIVDVFTINGGAAEVVEGEVLETSPLAGKTVHELALSDNIVIGVVIRGEEVLSADDDLVFYAGDHVVLLATSDALHMVEKLFRVSLDYF